VNEVRLDVFVSGASNDLAVYRRAARDALLDVDFHPLVQEHFRSDTRPLEETIRAMIERSDIVICLVGFDFGDAPPYNPKRSWCQMEYDTAVELEKPIHVFFSNSDLRHPRADRDTKRELSQQVYREGLKKRHSIRFFGSTEELRFEIAKLAVILQSRSNISRPEGLTAREIGILGGTVGGAISGVIIAALYFKADPSWSIAAEIIGYVTLVGSWGAFAIPALKQRVSRKLSGRGIWAKLLLNEVASNSLAGIVAGPLIGVFGVLLFAYNPMVMDVATVFPATSLGAAFVSGGILFSESASNASGRTRATLSSCLAFVVVVLASTLLGFLAEPFANLFSSTEFTFVVAGIVLSCVVGMEIGLQLGLARLIHEHLRSRGDPEVKG
jgi:hypothetical protein